MCDPKRTVRISAQNRIYLRMLRQTGQPDLSPNAK